MSMHVMHFFHSFRYSTKIVDSRKSASGDDYGCSRICKRSVGQGSRAEDKFEEMSVIRQERDVEDKGCSFEGELATHVDAY